MEGECVLSQQTARSTRETKQLVKEILSILASSLGAIVALGIKTL